MDATYEILMLGLVLAAAWRPAHEDWLKDRSSTPPVSSTMHALNALPAAALELVLLLDDVPPAAGVVVVVLVGVLVPHAASAIAATEATATIFVVDLNALSL